MGRKILLAVACWLTLSRSDADVSSGSAQIEDSVAEASLPRLYRSIPVGVYASASPYASFSFHVPTFAMSPKVAHVGPIKQESVIVENKQGFLKDSYGNKFVESPQALPYRTAYPQQYVQLQELPAHLAQPLVAAAPSFEYKQSSPHFFGPTNFKIQTVQAAAPSTANHYAINQPYEYGPIRSYTAEKQQYPIRNVEKSQRLEENPTRYKQHDHGAAANPGAHNKDKSAAIKQELKPSVPLLDLSLLEPLTFENPLVPQVQHFLPRISSVTYHKLPQLNVDGIKAKVKEVMIQKTKSYDDGDVESVPKLKSSRQQQRNPHLEDEDKRVELDSPRDLPHDDSREINSPNYRESYNEKVVNYNKETETEPVHYSYDMKSEKEPLSYNYVRTTKEPYREPKHNENNNRNQNDQKPKHLIYNFASEENDDDNNENHNRHRDEPEDSEEISENKPPARLVKLNQDKSYNTDKHQHGISEQEPHRKSEKIVHKQEEHKHKSNHHNSPPKHSQIETLSVDNSDERKPIILQEYEENIEIQPTPKKYASIKVDPSQHVQPKNHDSREHEDNLDDSPRSRQKEQYEPEQLVEEKAKRIIITEETPQEERQNRKEANDESPEHEGKNDEEFENGYKNSAYSFPAYGSKDPEKEIYNPEPYAPSKYQSEFDSERSPFQRYVAESDEYPKSTRSNYKDARDKTKDRYYLDYAISKPESMLARLEQKEDYYKTYMHRKPQYINDDDENGKGHKKSAKYSVAPGIDYHAAAQKPKHYFAKYKAEPRPQSYAYSYGKEAPKDSSAYTSGPYQRLKTHTQFVEPQFQYGFETSVLPRLLDSELSAMASNIRSENEKPLMRKKVYKENWYIKKTSTKGRKATS